jgi:hypothetical protein
MKEYKVELYYQGFGSDKMTTEIVDITCTTLIRDREDNKILYADGVKIKFSTEVGNIEIS